MKKGLLILCLSGLLISVSGIASLFFVQKNTDERFSHINSTYSLCEGTDCYIDIDKEILGKSTVVTSDSGIANLSLDGQLTAGTPGTAHISLSFLLSDYSFEVTVREHKGVIADCDEAYTCTLCGNSVFPKQEHEFTELTCTEDSICKLCGHVKEKAVGHKYSKLTCVDDSVCTVCGDIRKKATGHSWNEATCKRPRTCRKCYTTEGGPKEHEYSAATCTKDSACKWCGEPGEEKATGHDFAPATCVLAATCTKCGETKDKPLGHKAGKEVCGKPSTCTRCNEILSEALDHNWKQATCTKPKTCSRCKLTEGAALGHTVVPATCQKGSYCSVCNTLLSGALGHDYLVSEDTADYTSYICSRCGNTYQNKKVNVSRYAAEVLEIVNAERAAAGLSALAFDATLQDIAQARAVETTTQWSHTRPNGQSCFTMYDEYGYSYGYAGENIALGYSSPQSVMDGWMNSPGHRANILSSNFGRIGVGVYEYNGRIYWTQNFSD